MFNEKEYYKQYYQNNKERIRKKNDEYLKNHPNYTKKYRQKNKEKILKQRKEYYQKNKQYFKKHGKEYRQKNKKKLLKWRKEYERKNRQKIRVAFLNYLQKNRETWKGYIPKKTNCQICDKKIYFKQSKKQYNKEDVIHFDHRNKNSLIKRNPTSWLSIHPRTPKNQKIWESCDFGILCNRCNKFLPTKNRKEFISKAIKYIFGKEFNVSKNK